MNKKILLTLLVIIMFFSISSVYAVDNSIDSSNTYSNLNTLKHTDTYQSSLIDNINENISSKTVEKEISVETKEKTEKSITKSDNKLNTNNYVVNKKSSDTQTKVDVISKDTSTKKVNKTLKTTDNYYFNASVTNDGDGSKDNPWKTINQLNFNKITNGSTVYISNGNYNVDNIDVNIDVNIIGENTNKTIIKGYNTYDEVFNFNKHTTITNITFTNSSTKVIYNTGTLELNNCIFKNNNITSYDACIKNNGKLTVNNCLFNNVSSQKSSVIYNSASNSINLYLKNSIFTNNNAYKGIVLLYGSCAQLYNTTFNNNKATIMAGCIYLEKSSMNVNLSTFINNSVLKGTGGVFYVYDSDLFVNNSIFSNNYALFGGVATFLNGSGDGEEITESKHNSTIINSSFTNNKVLYDGGVFFDVYSNLDIRSSNFTNNSARNGGSIYGDYSKININNTIFKNNTATYFGGSIYTNQIDIALNNNNFINNKATKAEDVYSQYSRSFTSKNNTQTNTNSIITNQITTTKKPQVIITNLNNTPITTIPSSYDLRKLNQVTSVKSQSGGGNCWSFATMGALESCILKATGISYDLSENNMKNIMALFSQSAWCISPNLGGYDEMPITYLINWYGPTDENNDPYIPEIIVSPQINNLIQINNVYGIPSRTNYTDNNEYKKAIMKYGAVYTDIYWLGSNVDNTHNSYYCHEKPEYTNHAVCIVGWDDNYNKNNFITPAPGNGAFIIKNSWGTSSGENGYYYVSYYDESILNTCDDIYGAGGFTFIINNTETYDKIYQYDVGGISNWLESNKYGNYSNEYISSGNELIKAFGTYVSDLTNNYTVSIYVNNVLKHTQKGLFTHLGYETVQVTKSINVKTNDKIKVVLELVSSSTVQIPISESKYTRIVSTTNSYVNGKTNSDSVACLKLYTSEINKSEVDAVVTKSNLTNTQLLINIHDTNGNSINTGTITIKENNTILKTVQVTSNQTYVDLGIKKGIHLITVCYNASNYAPSNTTLLLNIGATTINSDVLNSDLKNTTIKVVVRDSNNNLVNSGRVVIYNNNNLLTNTTLINGQAIIVLNLNAGTQTLNILYLDDNLYQSSNITQTITVKAIDTKMSVVAYSKLTTNSTIEVTVTDITGKLVTKGQVQIINQNGQVIKTGTINNGRVNITLTSLPTGRQQYTAKYTEGTIYGNSSYTVIITVKTTDTKTTVKAYSKLTTNSTIEVTVKDITGKLVTKGQVQIINQNGQVIKTGTINNGRVNITLTSLPTGRQQYTARYTEGTIYTQSQAGVIITVKTTDTKTTVKAYSKLTTNSTIEVTVTDITGKLVTKGQVQIINQNGQVMKTGTINNGRVNITLTSLPTGRQQYTARYTEGTIYTQSQAGVIITVKTTDTKISVDVYKKYTTNTSMQITVKDITGKLVTKGQIQIINQNGQVIKTGTINNGRVNITLTSLPTGSQKFIVKYTEGTIYTQSTYNITLTIIKDDTTTLTYKNIKTYNSNTTIDIRVNGGDNNQVTGKVQILNSRGRLLKSMTLKNGHAIITLGLPLGKQTLSIIYLGDKTHRLVNVSDTINVLNQTVKSYDSGNEIVLKKIITTSEKPDVEALGDDYQYVDDDGTYTITSSEILRVQRLDSLCQQIYGFMPKYTFFREEGSNIKYVIERSKWNVISRALNKYHVNKGFTAVNPPHALRITLKDKIRYYPVYYDSQEVIGGVRYTCGPTAMSMISQGLNKYNSERKLSNVYKTTRSEGTYESNIIKYSPSVNMTLIDIPDSKSAVISSIQSGAMVLWHIRGHYMNVIGYNSANDKFLCLNPSGPSHNIEAVQWASWNTMMKTDRPLKGYGFMKVVPKWYITSSLNSQVKNYYMNMGGKYTTPNNSEKLNTEDAVTYIV
ncbi:C1 family peptidase [Methanosphaera stadtmanae]|uniref:Member of asn/thr-rich large protein family n=3 Tax=Methanosphaera TaxID=2316 RepID=Q2NG83_METST|nr:C1 family peptidase [Methanosphaera stadtmanae]ABC57170.1 member of asn/thr-rich large protein family [Methanosphaera stadtmanae DSM 3091]